MNAKLTHICKESVKKRGKENQTGNCEAANMAFSRLGVILHEIAQNDTTTYQPDNDKCHLPPREKPPLASKSKNKKGGEKCGR